VKLDNGAVADVMVQAFEKADGINVSLPATEAEALQELRSGSVQGVLVLPAGLQTSFARGSTTELPFRYDDSNVATAGQVVGLTQQIVEPVGNSLADIQPRLGIAGSMVTFKEKGVLRRLRATPLPMRSFMGSNVSTRVATALIQSALVLAVGMLLFRVTVNRSLALVALVTVVGAGCFVSLGFAIAGVSRNQELAQVLMNVVRTPMMFQSGIFFPMTNAPAWIQPVVKLLPLTYLANALRAVILDGASLWAVRWDLAFLLLATGVFVVVAWRFFRWE
jgi:hypothetical protein